MIVRKRKFKELKGGLEFARIALPTLGAFGPFEYQHLGRADLGAVLPSCGEMRTPCKRREPRAARMAQISHSASTKPACAPRRPEINQRISFSAAFSGLSTRTRGPPPRA